MISKLIVISKLGTEYIVEPTISNGKESFIVKWKNENEEGYSSDVQDKESVIEHLNDGSWKLKDII